MHIEWDVTPDAMIERLTQNYVQAIRAGIVAIAKRRAPEITEWMQTNRPWTDRTHDAKDTLHTEVEEVEQGIIDILLQHGVTYGWYLEGINPATMAEMANAGKWAILAPAVDHFTPVIVADIERILR